MRLKQLLLIDQVMDAGAEDRIFDWLLLAGPLIIALIAFFGRSQFTVGLAMLYLGVFVVHTMFNTYGAC